MKPEHGFRQLEVSNFIFSTHFSPDEEQIGSYEIEN